MPLVAHVRRGRKGEKGDLEGQDKISEGQVKIKPTPLDNAKTLSVSSSGRRKGVIQHILLWESKKTSEPHTHVMSNENKFPLKNMLWECKKHATSEPVVH
jgi:hypothetical protein